MKKLITQSLPDALKGMEVGETRLSPDGRTPAYVKRACSGLKKEGYLFSTATKDGRQTVTRIK